MNEASRRQRRVMLGDVAVNSTTATKDYEADGFTRYIIGKHIREDGVRITSSNPVGDAEFGSRIRTIVRAGDIICTTRGPKLKVAVAAFDCLSAHTNFVLRPKNASMILPPILEAVVRSDGFQDHLRRHFRGSTNLFVNWSDAARYEFTLPPIEEQETLARELSALETARQDAYEARVSGEQFLEILNWNLCTGKNASGPRQDITEWQHARLPGLTSIPRGWQFTRLTSVARLESGHTPSRSRPEYWNGDIPWISLGDIQNLGQPTISDTKEHIAQAGIDNSSARLLPKGTVVLSRDASIGFTSVISRPMATSQHFADFVCGDAITPAFLYWLFSAMKEYFDYAAVGSTNIKTLYMPFFQNMQIALPPRSVQDGIVDQLEHLRVRLDALRNREADHARLSAIFRESRIGGSV